MKKRIASCALLLASLLVPVGGANAGLNLDNLLLTALGGAIFSDANLSSNRNQSCMSCHHPKAGFADPDNLANPTKSPVSEGSVAGRFGGRNAPSAAYTKFSPDFYYNITDGLFIGGMFWDGRATGATLHDPLAEQAQGPFLNPVEMNLNSKESVLQIIKKAPYAPLFYKAFGPSAFKNTEQAYNNVGLAVSAFEQSRLFNQFSSKFDKFWVEQGKDVSQFGVVPDPIDPTMSKYVGVPGNFRSRYFTRQEAEGLALFNAADKGKCALCHLTTNLVDSNNKTYPPVFTDFTYDNLGIPVNPRIAELAGPQPIDYGLGARYVELSTALMQATGTDVVVEDMPDGLGNNVQVVKSEIGKFKVPTLRNIARTAPYGHNGYFATLETITNFYNTRDVASWPASEVPDTVNHVELGKLGLSAKEEAAIVAFMKTLTD